MSLKKLEECSKHKQLGAMLRSKAKKNTTNGSVDFVDQSGKRVPGTGHGSGCNSQHVEKKSWKNLALKDSMSSSRAVRPDIPNQFHQSGRTSGRKRPIHRTIWLHWLQTERSISGAGSKVCRPVKSHPPSSRNPWFPLSSWCMDISSSPAIHETPLQRSPKSPRNIAKNQ